MKELERQNKMIIEKLNMVLTNSSSAIAKPKKLDVPAHIKVRQQCFLYSVNYALTFDFTFTASYMPLWPDQYSNQSIIAYFPNQRPKCNVTIHFTILYIQSAVHDGYKCGMEEKNLKWIQKDIDGKCLK